MKLLPKNWCALLICTHFVLFVRLGGALLLYITACPGSGVRKIEKFFWGLISLLRLAETMLGRPQSCWGKKETEHKWSCTTPMSWPKKVIKKAFGHHRGCIVKHFPHTSCGKKILDALFFPARLSVVEKLVQNTVSLNFPAFFRIKQEMLSFQLELGVTMFYQSIRSPCLT